MNGFSIFGEMPFGMASGVMFVLGCCFGSFLNVCIWRMPRGESVVTAPSHCPNCNYHIRWYENIPLASFLVLRGRCSHCRKPISPRYFSVELLTGVLFLLYFLKCRDAAAMISAGTLISLCIVTVFTDIEHRIIPDAATYPAMGLALIGAAANAAPNPAWATALFCAALGVVVALLLSLFALAGRWLLHQDALGWGDVKFVVAAAMLLNQPAGAFFVLLAGSLSGALVGVVWALLQKKPLRNFAIPFGPFLAAAAMVWLFAGSWIYSAYVSGIRNLFQ